jgi:hypothetical protein
MRILSKMMHEKHIVRLTLQLGQFRIDYANANIDLQSFKHLSRVAVFPFILGCDF